MEIARRSKRDHKRVNIDPSEYVHFKYWYKSVELVWEITLGFKCACIYLDNFVLQWMTYKRTRQREDSGIREGRMLLIAVHLILYSHNKRNNSKVETCGKEETALPTQRRVLSAYNDNLWFSDPVFWGRERIVLLKGVNSSWSLYTENNYFLCWTLTICL